MSLQIRRGTAAELANITPVVGELIYTTDTQSVFVGDGATGGGIPIAVGGSGNVSGTNVLTNGLVSATGNIVGNNFIASGFVTAVGNITGAYIIGNGSQLTGLPASYGNANVVANLAALSSNPVSTTGTVTAGILSVTGNTTLGNLSVLGSRTINVGNNRITNVATPSAGTDAATKDYVDGVASSGFTIEDSAANTTIVGAGDTLQLLGTTNQITVAVTASDQVTFSLPSAISISGNVTGGNLVTGGLITATGNVTGGNLRTGGVVSATGNITGGNLAGTNISGTLSTASQTNITSVGTLTSLNSGTISSSGNITGGNLSGTNIVGTLTTAAQTNITSVGTLSSLSVSGNVQGGNIRTVGLVSATGNVTGDYFIGNGSQLTGITVAAGSAIVNGTSNVSVALNGNVTVGVAGTSAVSTFATTGQFITGLLSASGNITGGNLSGTNIVGTLTTAAQTNITSVGTLSSLNSGTISSSGNVTGANILTGGLISATGNITAGNLSVGTGAVAVGSIVNNNANGVGNIGTTTTRFNTVFALASSAQYADLAERYLADQPYAPGTVVAFGGAQEITRCDQDHDVTVAGIVSDRPAYEMNAGLIGDNPVAIALAGRVPCKVAGPVKRGQMLVSAGAGMARAESNPKMGAVIGKALQDFDGDTGMIEVVIGRL